MSKTTKIRQQTFAAPAAANNTGVHAAFTLPASGTTEVTTDITNPAVPRTIRLKGNQDGSEGVQVILEGTDIFDQSITHDSNEINKSTVPLDATLNGSIYQAASDVPATFPAYNRLYG